MMCVKLIASNLCQLSSVYQGLNIIYHIFSFSAHFILMNTRIYKMSSLKHVRCCNQFVVHVREGLPGTDELTIPGGSLRY